MDNTVLIDSGGGEESRALTLGIMLYGYRRTNSPDKRLRLTTLERPIGGIETIVTRILLDSEDFDGQSGIYEVIEIDSGSHLHEILDDESNSGWIEGGSQYSSGGQTVVTLTANEILALSGSILTIGDIDRTISW